ncbi:MAG: carbamoyltransferase C-terminal domain-containing protein [Candidatus Omnitrophota bacterium]|jgi:carbamoyltransferase
MNILGVSCFYHDSAACLVRDGEIIAAVQEERFSRKKYDSQFPSRAINWSLYCNSIKPRDLSCIACVCDSVIQKAMIICRLGFPYFSKIRFFNSQDAFLAAAFYPSPFKDAAILVNARGVGVILASGEGSEIKVISGEFRRPSLSLVYSGITRYLGFMNYGDEFKVMGLSAYGKPKYKDIILKHREESPRFLSNPARLPNQEITQFHMNVASSLQAAVEDEVLNLIKELRQVNKSDNLCLSGDLALNCLLNAKIIKKELFKNIWIQPAADFAGCAVGAALLAWYGNNTREVKPGRDGMSASLLGPAYNDDYIGDFLKKSHIAYKRLTYPDIQKYAAALLSQGSIVGWFQGKTEFGPRALGNRSILGDSRDLRMHRKLNLEVKKRESFRPFAPVVLWEKAGDYFDLDRENPYMLFTAQVKESRKGEIPAVTHADGSSRVQTLRNEDNPIFYGLVNEFYKKTGCPVIINTSFNSGPEPMVLTPEDAYRCFKSSAIDCLVLGCFLITK